MIKYKKGNILKEPAEALVNSVNCVGIMGRGIALQFKNSYPQNFKAYKDACKRGEIQPGRMFIYQISSLTNPKYIINFPTKRHWRGKSKMEDIELGLTALVTEIRNRNIQSIAIPPLGCGLGGLNWYDVKSQIETILCNLDNISIIVFEPNDKLNPNEVSPSRDVPKMTAGRAALIRLIYRYLGGLMDPFISLLEIHKLMYFMQEAGESLRLKYQKADYGPYAENLRHVLHHIEGHLLTGYADGGDTPHKKIELVPGAIKDAMDFFNKSPETVARFEKVTALVEGFETSFGLELLATVHWIVSKENISTQEDIVQAVYAWNKRKYQFTERQIHLAYERLRSQGWFKTKCMR